MQPPQAAEPDLYLMPFLLIGLPMILFMAAAGVVAVRRRWRPVAIILGVVFLLTAGSLLKDARHRQEASATLIVQGVGLASGAAGLLLLLWSILYRPKILPPRRE